MAGQLPPPCSKLTHVNPPMTKADLSPPLPVSGFLIPPKNIDYYCLGRRDIFQKTRCFFIAALGMLHCQPPRSNSNYTLTILSPPLSICLLPSCPFTSLGIFLSLLGYGIDSADNMPPVLSTVQVRQDGEVRTAILAASVKTER